MPHENNNSPCPNGWRHRALQLLANPRFIAENTPQVISYGKGHIGLELQGILWRRREKYMFHPHQIGPCTLQITLQGKRSTITITYQAIEDTIKVKTTYTGPQKRKIQPQIQRIAENLALMALQQVLQEQPPEPENRDPLSKKLCSHEYIKQLMGEKIQEKLVPLIEGHLPQTLTRIAQTCTCPSILVTGESQMGIFNAVLVNGEIQGASYTPALGGKPLLGLDAVKSVEGLYNIRVYCIPENMAS